MIRTLPHWARPLAGAVALLVALALASPPCLAGDAPPSQLPPATPLADATAAKVAALNPAPEVALVQGAGPAASAESKPFLKTPKGIATIVLMAVGLTWAAVSRNKDAVHSPARQ